MRKLISFMHVSLDGFVAGPTGEMNWIKVNEEIFEYVDQRIGQGDTAVYGRKTYEMMEGYWPAQGDDPGASQHDIHHSRWYNQVHKVVLSKTMQGAALPNTTVISGDLAGQINAIKRQPGNEMLLFGSPTATHALIQQGLIDGYWLFVNPVILGQGVPLFPGAKDRVNLKLLSTRPFTSGVTELSYLVDKQ